MICSLFYVKEGIYVKEGKSEVLGIGAISQG